MHGENKKSRIFWKKRKSLVISCNEMITLEGVHKNSHDCFLRVYPEKEQSAIIRAEINPKFN